MAIKQTIDTTTNLITTISDSGKYILREDGIKYESAVDPINSGRTYTESDESIPVQTLSTDNSSA